MRKKDFEKLYEPKNKDLEELIKALKGKGDKEKINDARRFLDPSYTKGLYRGYTQEVVFRIITKGTGKRHLSTLIGYLSRDLSHQKDKDKCDLFDHNNEILDADRTNSILENWSLDFTPVSTERNPILDEAFIEFDKLETVLEDKHYNSSLTKEEGKIHNYLRSLKENKYNESKIDEGNQSNEIKVGKFCYFEEDKKYGILIKEPDCKYPLLVTTDENLKLIKTPIFDESFVQPLNKEMKQTLASKPRDFSHIVLSAGGDNPNKELVEAATKQFLEASFKSKGYEYIYTTHNDTKNLHTHVIVNNYSRYNEVKFCPDKFELQELRVEYKNHLDDLGIDRTATLKIDRKNYLKKLKNDAENIKNVRAPYIKDKIENIENHDMDILKFRKNGMEQIDRLSNQLYRQGEHKLATELLKEKENYRIVEPETIREVVTQTCNIIEKEAPQIAKVTKRNLAKRIGKPSDYKIEEKSTEIKDEVLEKYKEKLEKTKENLEELYFHPKMTPNLERQNDKAIEYLEKRIRGVSKALGCEYDEGRSRQ